MEYRKITEETKAALQLPNEPFELFGQMIVHRKDNQWLHETKLFDQVETMTFPNEDYDFELISQRGFALGAYHNNKCIGLAIYQYDWNKYLFLHDLKVTRAFRKQGVAGELIKEGQKYAAALGYEGLYTIAQDNNLAACKFYLKQGFEIGGLNTHDYQHTKQEGKADIYFYLENNGYSD
jgi:ribosomal protein S18 acetylase RimI-like enzyme